MPASPPIFVSISRSRVRDKGGGGGCRVDTGDGRTGNGTVPRAGGETALTGGLAKCTPRGAGGLDVWWGSREGRRVSREGRSLSRDGRDLPRDGRNAETVEEGVCARSNEGRGWRVNGGDGWLTNGDRGGGDDELSMRTGESGAGRAGAGRAAESPGWSGKACRAGEGGGGRVGLDGVLAGGMASRAGVEMRTGGEADGRGRSDALDMSGGRRWSGSRLGARTGSPSWDSFSWASDLSSGRCGTRRAAECGLAGGLWRERTAGRGSGGHTWSPRLARETSRPQLEHFTVGRTWDTRGVCST